MTDDRNYQNAFMELLIIIENIEKDLSEGIPESFKNFLKENGIEVE